MSRKDRFFFEKFLVSSGSFNVTPDLTINIIDNESLLFINEGTGAVEISFDGIEVHSELNPATGTNSLIANYPSVNKIWLRLKSGAASVVRVQNDASIASSTTVNLSGVTLGGTSSNFGDPFPIAGTASGFYDGTNMQGAKVFDANSGAGIEYVLGTVLRASGPSGSVEAGTLANPLRVDPTGSTAQPVTDNGSSLTVDTTQLPAALVGGRLDNNVGAWLGSTAPTVGQKTAANSVPVVVASDNGLALDATLTNGTQKAIVRGGAKGTTVAADVTSENVDANTQALHVYVKGSNTDTNYPLALDGYGALDAFGRFRVSTPYTIFESKQLFDSDSQAIAWDTQLTSGGTSTYSQNRASSTLNVTSTVGSKVIRQTRARFNYQAGKSLLILSTFVMGAAVSGISKKSGYFDDKNGIYFHNNGAANSLVIRSYVTGAPIENEVFQEDWNIDTLDGYGPSGVTLDVSKAQIFFTDIEWLGVGSVRCGFVIDGISYYVHKFNHSNIINSVYMSTPNLPLRFEIENLSSGTGSLLEQICCSVISEGGYENQGFSFATDRGVTPLTNVDSSRLYPVLSLRLASNRFGTQFLPQFIDAFCTTSNANFKWALIVNPTINGVDTASWNPIIGSAIEYDISRTVSNYVTGGYVITSGYGNQKSTTNGSVIQGTFSFGSTIAGVSDQLVLAVQKFGGGTDSFVGSISWKEFT